MSHEPDPHPSRTFNPWILISILGIALVLLLIAIVMPPLQQAALIRHIESIGGEVHCELDGPEWKVSLIEDMELEALFGTPTRVDFIRLWFDTDSRKVHDGLIRRIARWRTIRELDLTSASITQASVPVIASLEQLEWLSLHWVDVTDDWLVDIAKLKNLSYLSIDGSKVTTTGLHHAATMPSVRTLWLAEVRGITDESLVALAPMTALSELYLDDNPQIAGKDFDQLPRSLTVLSLSRTGVTDEALMHLRDMKHLDMLYIDGCKVTPQAVEALKQHLPDLEVYSD